MRIAVTNTPLWRVDYRIVDGMDVAVCERCGAVVANEADHAEWHDSEGQGE